MNKYLMIIIAALLLFLAGCSEKNESKGSFGSSAIDCSISTGLAFLQVDGENNVCYEDDELLFSIENTGTTHITGLQIRIDGEYSALMKLYADLPPGKGTYHSLHIVGGSEDIDAIHIYPMIGNQMRICSEMGIDTVVGRC